MEYISISCDSLLKRITAKDTLFSGDYCIDPYQNCEFGCLYCDSAFDKTIYVKTNAAKILERELEKTEKGVIIVGSVHDPYQKAEEEYEITKNLLKIIKKFQFPCHILTKSTLVLRDIDLLLSMQCMITVSITSLDEHVSQIFEKNIPLPKERLKLVQTLSEYGINTGVALIPVLPYIVEHELDDIVKAASGWNAQYLLHKHLELKGDQKLLFKDIIREHYTNLLSKYNKLYRNDLKPDKKYISDLNDRIRDCCKKYNISDKITVT